MAVLWTVNDFFYVAGTLNAENLSGDIFINFSLISLTEMPSVFIGQFLIGKLPDWPELSLIHHSDRFGRRWMHVACMVLATLPLFISIFVVEDERYGGLLVGLTMASKTASNVGWFIMWVQAIEIFPTPLRNTGEAEREAGRLRVSGCRSDCVSRGGHTHLHDGALRG